MSFVNCVSRRKAQQIEKRMKKKLTCETRIDNLKKFAKTSLVAEVILDRLKYSRKEIEREI
jgi:hypothetical protein